MNENNLIQSLDNGERVTSTYADIYYDDDYCDFKPKKKTDSKKQKSPLKKKEDIKPSKVFVSPSDLLIGKVDLVPPFTSKVTRGITHDGILEIGESVLQRERDKFLKKINALLAENDLAWGHIHESEKISIAKKVKEIYEKIFQRKSAIMQNEIAGFYEDTLRELETHLRSEVRTVLISTRCSMIHDLNAQIKEKLENERKILQKDLTRKYDQAVRKVTRYYKLLLQNEKQRAQLMINNAIQERNDALKIFINQVEAEATTGTMYVMSSERKKCRMRQFLLETYQTHEIEALLKSIKEKSDILDEYQKQKTTILNINKEWEEKVQKVLKLFLKFISFSLKLLPEQTTFLLDLEKLVVLQLNEFGKHPTEAPKLLVNEDDFKCFFQFKTSEAEQPICDKEPFVIEGDLASSVSTSYGSQDNIPLDKELTFFRLQRQFIYAKCQKLKEVQDFIESQRCKCRDSPTKEPSIVESSSSEKVAPVSVQPTPESSTEHFKTEDFHRLEHCPCRACKDYIGKFAFPNLDEYLEYSDRNYSRVDAILGRPTKLKLAPRLLDPKDILNQELPFAATKELYKNAETQFSSPASSMEDLKCPCMEERLEKKQSIPLGKNPSEDDINIILAKRKRSLLKLFHEHPKLLQLFSDGSEDFIL